MTTSSEPERDKIATFGAFVLLLIIIIVSMMMSGCGSSYHLRRAEHHLKKAELKGAKIDIDTVYKLDTVRVFVASVKTDTVFQSEPGDTVRIEKDRLSIRYVNLPGDSVFIEGECKADTVVQVRNIPVTVTKEISAGISVWDVVILSIFIAVVAYIFGMFRKRKSLG